MTFPTIKTINIFKGRSLLVCLIFFSSYFNSKGSDAKYFLNRGWNALVQDSDVVALKYFGLAYEEALTQNDTENIAAALLNMGICYYSVSYSQGMEYCFKAMAEYKKMEKSAPEKAFVGRCRCLQLISTIYSRQGKYREAIELSKEAIAGFINGNDTAGYLGLIYFSLGSAYDHLGNPDSSEYFHRLALQEQLLRGNFTYQPKSYIQVGDIELRHGNKTQSLAYYDRALFIGDSTGNRQAQVSALIAKGKWFLIADKNEKIAEEFYLKAEKIAGTLSDKSFFLNSLESLLQLKKQQGDFRQALAYQQQMEIIRDTMYTWDKQKAVQSLEIEFGVSEKERQLQLVKKEKDIAQLNNYLLWVTIGFLIIISIGAILFLKRINKRDKLLLQTKEELVKTIEEKKRLTEKQMQNEIEFRESQLSAMTLQMLQKNELMQELKDRLDQDNGNLKDNILSKIISKGQNHDKEWSDFNTHFESVNKNFYDRLKQAYPEISPNDLKICALIKLNLSIKEMAGILNISPDSVKTARYRLRKKLQLNTEDNLTEFILRL